MSNDGELQYVNGYDESTTVMKPLVNPTYQQVLDLPDHTEVVCMWESGDIDGFDIDEKFKDNMRDHVAERRLSLDQPTGVVVLVFVTPDKMHPTIASNLTRR